MAAKKMWARILVSNLEHEIAMREAVYGDYDGANALREIFKVDLWDSEENIKNEKAQLKKLRGDK